MSKTFTTGQASIACGFMVNGKFIEKMGLEPAAMVKGNPIWDMADWDAFRKAVKVHMDNISPPVAAPAAPRATPKSVKAATPVDDDEEL